MQKAGSKPSLIAGLGKSAKKSDQNSKSYQLINFISLAFGGLLGVGTYLTSVSPNQVNSYYLSLGTSTVLGKSIL